jgi:hypothetical protein
MLNPRSKCSKSSPVLNHHSTGRWRRENATLCLQFKFPIHVPFSFTHISQTLNYKFHFYFFKERTSWEIRSYRNQDGVGNYNGDSSLVLPLLGLGQGTWGDSWILRGKEKVVGLCSFLHGHESRPRLSFPEAPTVMSIPYHWHVSQHSKDCRSA